MNLRTETFVDLNGREDAVPNEPLWPRCEGNQILRVVDVWQVLLVKPINLFDIRHELLEEARMPPAFAAQG
jgi:hypothetical protein